MTPMTPMTHVVLVVIDQYLTGCRTACHMLVHAHKRVNTNVPAQSAQSAQSAQLATNKPFYVMVEHACSSKAVTTLLIDTTDEHGDRTVRNQIAQAAARTPGLETSLVAQNKMTLFVNHNGMTLGQHNFYMIKPGDTLVVTGNPMYDIVDQMCYQLNYDNASIMQAMSRLNELGAHVFDLRCKLLACRPIYAHDDADYSSKRAQINDFACATLAWLFQQQLYIKKQLCQSAYITHMIKSIYQWDVQHFVGLVNLALDVANASFSTFLATFLGGSVNAGQNASEKALDVALANLEHGGHGDHGDHGDHGGHGDHGASIAQIEVGDYNHKVWCNTREHIAAMLVSRLGRRVQHNFAQHTRLCLACLRRCSAYTAKCLFRALKVGVCGLQNVDCNDLLHACVAHASRWPSGAPRMYRDIGMIVARAVEYRRCSWSQLVASGFLEKNTLPIVARKGQRECHQVGELVFMVTKCCDDWSADVCNQLIKVLDIIAPWKDWEPMSRILTVLGKYDRHVLLEHHSVLAGAFEIAAKRLVKAYCKQYANMLYQFCKLINKLDIKVGEPGRQAMCQACGAFQQACKGLKSKKHAHARIWAGRLAKQYSEHPTTPTIPTIPAKPAKPVGKRKVCDIF